MREATKQRTFLIAAGGTGGHVIPGIAIAGKLRARGHRCVFVGTRRGLEGRLAPEAGFAIEFVDVGPWNGVSPVRRLRTLLEMAPGLLAAGSILKRTGAAAVLSLGGYAAAAIVLTALGKGIPVVVLEPNVKPGMVNRLAGPFAAWTLTGFEEAVRYFPAARCEVSGVPIRPEFFEVETRRARSPFTVLVTGGSLGARRLNRAAIEAAVIWRDCGRWPRMRLVHQTGEREYAEVCSSFNKQGLAVEVAPFLPDMSGAFAEADVIVCRAGASTVAELSAAGKASVLAPYPFAADQHQLVNAQAMEAAGAARVVMDRDLDGKRLVGEVAALMDDPDELTAMEEAARGRARWGAVEKVADRLERAAGVTS